MLRHLIVFAIAVVTWQTAAAQDRPLGLGVILGEPSGISFKSWLGKWTAWDAGIAWSIDGEDALHLHGDYLLHDFGLFEVDEGKLGLYYGIGGRLRIEDNSRLGVRIPVGLEYMFEGAPVDIFFELVPLLDLAPDTEFLMNGGIGARYFFPTRR